MSGSGGKSKSQTTLAQKGKTTTTHRTTADTEAQDRGRTRAAGSWEINEDGQEICDSEKGRSFLEDKLLLIPDGAPLTLDTLSTTLFQIAAMQGLVCLTINAIQAVAYLLKEVEVGEIAGTIREITNDQFNKMTKDLKEFTEGLREKVTADLEKKTEVLEKKTMELTEVVEKVAQQAGSIGSAPYRDALFRAVSGAPLDANPRLAAKESIRQRQSLIDLPRDSRLRDCANLVLVGKFSEAMGRATAQKHKVRLAIKIQNGGILVEMVMDEGAAWLASSSNAEAFL